MEGVTKMSDLIDIRSAVEALAELVPYAIDDDVARAYMDGLTDACDLICQLPSVQPEYTIEMQEADIDEAMKSIRNARPTILPPAQPEIIRCKDCIMHGVCRYEQRLGTDGYCSLAERRTDGVDS